MESGIIKIAHKNDMPVCRNGRRGGLKIPCANNTCGFDPHHRHKKETPSACLGEFLFYLRRVSGSNSTALPSRASDQPCGLSLSARETPTIGTKQAVRTFSGSGLLYFCCKSYLCVLRENADDGIGRGDLAGKIQMGINIAGGADIAVPQPFLNFLQAHAVGVKQAGAA